MDPRFVATVHAFDAGPGQHAWCRRFPDGTTWAGVTYCTPLRFERFCEHLTACGYRWRADGKKGTSGEFILTVINPDGDKP